jgi:hypothetical protein
VIAKSEREHDALPNQEVVMLAQADPGLKQRLLSAAKAKEQ